MRLPSRSTTSRPARSPSFRRSRARTSSASSPAATSRPRSTPPSRRSIVARGSRASARSPTPRPATAQSARAYYVRSDGNDGNKGTANSAAGAWRTIQHAVDYIAQNLDINGFLVTVQLQSGVTFTEQVQLKPYAGQYVATQTNPTIQGD